jgi:hypothetical protein
MALTAHHKTPATIVARNKKLLAVVFISGFRVYFFARHFFMSATTDDALSWRISNRQKIPF